MAILRCSSFTGEFLGLSALSLGFDSALIFSGFWGLGSFFGFFLGLRSLGKILTLSSPLLSYSTLSKSYISTPPHYLLTLP
jgi:hypothetical protein